MNPDELEIFKALEVGTNQRGEKIIIRWLAVCDAASAHFDCIIACATSAYYGLGNCSCVYHEPVAFKRIGAGEAEPLIALANKRALLGTVLTYTETQKRLVELQSLFPRRATKIESLLVPREQEDALPEIVFFGIVRPEEHLLRH